MTFERKIIDIEARTNVIYESDDGTVVEKYDSEKHDVTLMDVITYSVYVRFANYPEWHCVSDCYHNPMYAKLLARAIADHTTGTFIDNIEEV